MTRASPFRFVAADWGTSSLRLWLMEGDGVLGETRSADGMASVPPGSFPAVLAARLAALGVEGTPEAPLPVVACGMVGARQGWREAGYVDLPAVLADLPDRAVAVAADGVDLRILPGLSSRDEAAPDVIRGEETQLLGLAIDRPGLSALACLPGTHGKWARIEAGVVTAFSTAMTGELFALLSARSILAHAIAAATPSGDPESPAFRAGLDEALAGGDGLPTALFRIRARGLLFGASPQEAADRLSGLLIGAEIAPWRGRGDGTVLLLAAGTMAGLYRAGLERAGFTVETADADACVRRGLAYAAARLWPAASPSAPSDASPR